jgi:signal transduction histidine kinase
VLSTGRPLVVPVLTDEKIKTLARGAAHLEALRRLGPTSFMVVPLNARGRTIGAITLGLDEPGRGYTATDLSFAEELARRAALAIDNARLYSRAQQANRAKDEFLATLSHELRTPLTPVIGWVHMMRSGHLDEAGVEQGLEVIDKNAQALLRLINDLLDMTSILSGKMRIERAPVELGRVLSEAVETVRPQADAKGVALELADGAGADEAATALVSGDRTRLVQVFWNLLSNAVKFSRKGARVRVESRVDGAAACVEVVDEGSGIETEFLPRVFDRFSQADGSTTRAHGGLGLGLAVVRHLVEQHGGTVRAASEGAHRGSTFTVNLPISAVDTRAAGGGRGAAGREHEARAPQDVAGRLRGVRVPLVDAPTDTR